MRSSNALTGALLCLSLLLGACASDDSVDQGGDGRPDGTGVEVPDRAPDLTGTITAITLFEPVTEDCTAPEDLDPDGAVSSDDPPVCTADDDDTIGTILVEGELAPERGRKIVYTVAADTKITGTVGGDGVGAFADFAEGQVAETWAAGPCAESYPEQCTLEAIRVTG